MHSKILIIGAGISGLNSGLLLKNRGFSDFKILEAKSDSGGRIYGEKKGNGYTDMGPSWFWENHLLVKKLLKNYNISYFEQFEQGDILFQNQIGKIEQYPSSAMQMGGYRIDGGYKSLTRAMSEEIDQHITYDTIIKKIEYSDGLYTLTCSGASHTYSCEKLVLAIPPRIITENINVSHCLSAIQRNTLADIPTWMGNATKILLEYPEAFWRKKGFSGNGVSYKGPIGQFHDASLKDDSNGAIFGFIMNHELENIEQECLDQLEKIFGAEILQYTKITIKKWGNDIFASSKLDRNSTGEHPRYFLPRELEGILGGTIVFSATEFSENNGGFVEGALDASEQVLNLI